MPNYTTSYSSKTKPRYRKNTGNQLPSGRRRQQRRKGAQYLRRSQGFGGRRRPGHGYGGNDRRVYALIMVGCAFLLFVASIVWYANRSVEITLNGAAVKVRINSDIERVISDQELELEPGDLLAVDDEGRVSPLVAARIGRDLFELVARMGFVEGGIAHRDISSGNVMVRTDRLSLDEQVDEGAYDLCLVDFGSAAAATAALLRRDAERRLILRLPSCLRAAQERMRARELPMCMRRRASCGRWRWVRLRSERLATSASML